MSNEMYLIRGDDYLSHIEDKVHLYSMLKQLNHQIARLPSNRGCKELSMLAAQYDAIAEEMFRSWGIPKSYLVFRNDDALAELMENELIDPEDAGFVACVCPCCEEAAIEEEIDDSGEEAGADEEADDFANTMAALATALHSIFGNNVAVHIMVE